MPEKNRRGRAASVIRETPERVYLLRSEAREYSDDRNFADSRLEMFLLATPVREAAEEMLDALREARGVIADLETKTDLYLGVNEAIRRAEKWEASFDALLARLAAPTEEGGDRAAASARVIAARMEQRRRRS
jgi:hypothetical protein